MVCATKMGFNIVGSYGYGRRNYYTNGKNKERKV